MATIESRELLDGLVEPTRRGAGVCIGRPSDRIEARIIAITDDPLPTWADAEKRAPELAGDARNRRARGRGPERQHPVLLAGPGQHRGQDRRRHTHLASHRRPGHHRRAGPDLVLRTQVSARRHHRGTDVHRPSRADLQHRGRGSADRPGRRGCTGCAASGAVCGTGNGADTASVVSALRALAARSELTADVDHFLIHPSFPVDIRHNAKIGREELAVWAARQLRGSGAQ